MSNEKMREEFEVWYEGIAGSSVEFNDGGIPVAMGGALSETTTMGMWLAWRASRESLCVNLPTNETTWPDGTELVDRKQVETSMDAAGVSYS